MKRPLLLAAAFAVLLLSAPLASAQWWTPRASDVEPAQHRVGDLWERHHEWVEVAADGTTSRGVATEVVLIEGLSEATDRYGILRPAVNLRVDVLEDGELTFAERCHVMQGGHETLRREVLHGDNGFGVTWERASRGVSLLPATQTRAVLEAHASAFFWGSCPLHDRAPSVIKVGDRVPIRSVATGALTAYASPGLSEPAESTTFHGRPAVVLRYDLAQLTAERDWPLRGTWTFTFAHGLPGIVEHVSDIQRPDGSAYRATSSWRGFSPGDGAPVPASSGTRLPERNPHATFVAHDRLRIDDTAFDVPYRFGEAFQNLLDDPHSELGNFLARDADAFLIEAWYDRQNGRKATGVQTDGTDGLWTMTFVVDGEAWRWSTARASTAGTPFGELPGLPAAVKPVSNEGPRQLAWNGPLTGQLTPEEADSASIARLAAQEGVDLTSVQHLWYGRFRENGQWRGYWSVHDMSQSATEPGVREGRNVNVGAAHAGATNVYAMSKRSIDAGLLAPGAERFGADHEASTLSALIAPSAGAGLAAAGAVTSLALLWLLSKFVLAPFYTRLVRTRILDHPMRARLHERVRAEPGIHRAALIEATGLGEGGTRHHLDQLVQHGYLVEMAFDGLARYYAAGEVPSQEARHFALLRNPTNQAVYELYANEPTLSLRAAAARLGVSAPTVHACKKRLEKEGLLPAARVAFLQ